jgi:hypothetical protein
MARYPVYVVIPGLSAWQASLLIAAWGPSELGSAWLFHQAFSASPPGEPGGRGCAQRCAHGRLSLSESCHRAIVMAVKSHLVSHLVRSAVCL